MTSNAQTEIRNLIEARHAAVGRGDADAAVAPLAKQSVVYDLQPPLSFEGAAARDTAGLNEWFGTWQSPPQVSMSDMDIRVEGDLAVANGLSRMMGTKKEEGAVDLWFRVTLVLEREGDDWRIVHEHQSVPMKMDGSGLAAVDLEP